eukprot:5330172-Pyramimonas_sp.AAC.1
MLKWGDVPVNDVHLHLVRHLKAAAEDGSHAEDTGDDGAVVLRHRQARLLLKAPVNQRRRDGRHPLQLPRIRNLRQAGKPHFESLLSSSGRKRASHTPRVSYLLIRAEAGKPRFESLLSSSGRKRASSQSEGGNPTFFETERTPGGAVDNAGRRVIYDPKAPACLPNERGQPSRARRGSGREKPDTKARDEAARGRFRARQQPPQKETTRDTALRSRRPSAASPFRPRAPPA